MRIVTCLCVLTFAIAALAEDLPRVPDGFTVDVVAREPLVSNPCVLAFDRRGRLFVGQGPQWRAPTPDTPGDRVDILHDDDGDGITDRRTTFAEGFNSVQGLAWRGRDLWVANAPELTIVRDLDGDDVADEYVRVYTGLGNLEHALHGLTFGPDGLLTMSKGNSKGLNDADAIAPLAFRELWGVPAPPGARAEPPVEVFTKDTYRRSYHPPADDWGQQGGILRCGADGRGLEIVARGCRNPWDIAHDDGFDWLGTDNDQTQGDKLIAPFHGAHFGWGHAWSSDWSGVDHLPTVPAAAPLFEGSGTGVVYAHATQFPPEYRGVFFVADWMRRQVAVFRPRWNGAALECADGAPTVFAAAASGRSLAGSSGCVFEPTDIEIGPDGCLYVLSWGHGYGATLEDGVQRDAGRVYRIRATHGTALAWDHERRDTPIETWSFDDLATDLVAPVPAWRIDAQDELLRRGDAAVCDGLWARLAETPTKAEETWMLWTLGRLAPDDPVADRSITDDLAALATDERASHNIRIQALRILAMRARRAPPVELPDAVVPLMSTADARLRHEAVQAVWRAGRRDVVPRLLDRAAVEADRVVFHALWKALRDLADPAARRGWLADARGGVRLAALLGLLEDDAAAPDAVAALEADPDPRIADLVALWLRKTGRLAPLVALDPPPGEYAGPVSVRLSSSISAARLTYTLDGSVPVNTSPVYTGPIALTRDSTLRVAVTRDLEQAGRVITGNYRIRPEPAYRQRAFVTGISAPSGSVYELDREGLSAGKRHYTDRDYRITAVPPALQAAAFIRTANSDDRSSGSEWLTFTTDEAVDVLVGVDARVAVPPAWMRVGQPGGFTDTGLTLATTDPVFRLFRRGYPPGRVVLGGNTDTPSDSRRGNYVVIFERRFVAGDPERPPATPEAVRAALATADPERGRDLFLHPRGAGCVKCHRMEGLGAAFAPDLSDIGSRARPEVLIESILEPSRVITEGFAQQRIITVDGHVRSGAVVEETGQSLLLVDETGRSTTIPKASIEERVGTHLSPMPAGFGSLLTAGQVADIVAWLRTCRLLGDRDGVAFRERPDGLDILLRGRRVATYLTRHPQLTRRALVNVTTPTGIPVTRSFPPRAPEDLDPGYTAEQGIIHPVMHPGIWISFGDLDGNDYWRLRARVEFDGFVEPPTAAVGGGGGFTAVNRLLDESGSRTVCTERTRYHFEPVPEGLLLRIEAEYRSGERDFAFGDQEESGLAVRVASPLRVRGGGGTILNDRGERNGAAVWGKEASWVDMFGVVDGREVGVMVVPDPANPRRSWLHARDYGVVVANPFPRQPMERREPFVTTPVRRGEPFRLSYTLLIHERSAGAAWDRDAFARRVSVPN